MKCQACNGKVSLLRSGSFPTMDQKGVCKSCGAVYLNENRTILAKTWCACPQTSIHELKSKECYFFCDNGDHGWMHLVCGQITQTG